MFLFQQKLEFNKNSSDESLDEQRFSVIDKLLDDLYNELMRFEIDLEDQLEENLEEFERTLSTHLDQFVQAIEVWD